MIDAGPTDAFPWQQWVREFELTNVRVIATFGDDGGAISEAVPSLQCIEGRLATTSFHEDQPLHQLEYYFGFAARAEADPMASSSTFGRVVILGTGPSGVQIEIRGGGWIGFDEKGNLEGRFDDPPIIITDDSDPEPYDDDETVTTPDGIVIWENIPLPPQYKRAIRRVPPVDLDL